MDTDREKNKDENPKLKELLKTKCQKDVIKAFGIPVDEKRETGFFADQAELDFCPKNQVTCCSGKEFEASLPTFQAAYIQLKALLEPLEELATLFTGEKFADEILAPLVKCDKESEKVTQRRTKCINEHAKLPNGKGIFEFSPSDPQTLALILEMTSLLSEKDYFEKRVVWYYGDLLCSICNVEDQEYLKSEDGKIKIDAHSATCSELFDMKEFELRLGMLYSKFLRPVLNTHTCFNLPEGETLDKKDLLPDIGAEKLTEEIMDYQKCFGEFTTEKDSECVRFCDNTLAEFKFSDDILNAYLKSLQVVFPVLAGMEAEDYYTDRKGTPFPENLKGTVKFYNLNGVLPENLKIKFASKGINVFVNHWSKKYRTYKRKDKSVQVA